MTYTILSAAYANPDHTAAVIQTKEAGAVAVSIDDTVELWIAMLDQGEPTEFTIPPAIDVLSKLTLYRRMTEDEASQVQSALGETSARLQGIFTAATEFHSDAEEYVALTATATDLFGAARAAELLAPG